MRRGVTIVLFFALLLCGMSAFAAQEKAVEYELGEIVVSGESPAESDAASSLMEVTAEQIEASGAKSLNEALALLPGVFIRVGGDGTPRVDIRGMRTRNVLILLDGVPLNSTYDYQFDPTLIAVENIARIKVVRGATSVLYGVNGNAGAINIITKKGQTEMDGMVGAEFSETGTTRLKASFSHGDDFFSIFGSASWYDSLGYPLSGSFDDTPYEDGGLRNNSMRLRKNLYVNTLFTPSEKLDLGLSVRYFDGSFEKPYIIYDEAKYGKQRFERTDINSGLSIQLSGGYDFDGPFFLRGWLFLNEEDETTNRYDDETLKTQVLKGAFEYEATTTIYGATLQPGVDFDEFGQFTSSLTFMRQVWMGYQQQVKKDNKSFVEVLDESRTVDIASASLEYEIRPIDEIGLVAGIGWHSMDKEETSSDDDYSYFLGLNVYPWDTLHIHANHARKVRFPSLKEMYDGDSGNPDLKPEITYHYELGAEYTFTSFSTTVGVTGFIIDAFDFIEKDAITDIRANFEEYRMSGVEAFVDAEIAENWKIKASYTYTEAFNRGDNRDYDRLQNRPRHMAAIETWYTCPFGAMIYLAYSYVGDQVDYSSDAADPGYLDVDDSHVVNAKLSQTLELTPSKELELYIGVNNIFDYDYEQSVGLPASGRVFYGGFEFRF